MATRCGVLLPPPLPGERLHAACACTAGCQPAGAPDAAAAVGNSMDQRHTDIYKMFVTIRQSHKSDGY